MGPSSDPMAVVDSRFKVHGTQNLRIVDASVFHKIPGFFIVSAVYMISEKASDVIHEDALTQQHLAKKRCKGIGDDHQLKTWFLYMMKLICVIPFRNAR